MFTALIFLVLPKTLCKKPFVWPILTLLFFFPSEVKGEAPKQYDVVVSLGEDCQVAWQMKTRYLRKNAYPFDFIITPFDGLINFIQNKGAYFLDPDQLFYVGLLPGSPHVHVLDLVYRFVLLHDFCLGYEGFANYQEIKDKYWRRIHRFYDLLHSNQTILFIRFRISRQQAEELDSTLHALYPNLSYTILALDDSEEIKSNWGLERVRNFYLRQYEPYFWTGLDQAWAEILAQFQIVPAAWPSFVDYE